MGSDNRSVVKERVRKEYENSKFNFKQGLKKTMLKVKHFKHHELANVLYDQFLATYGRFPTWNDEAPNYFAKFFYAYFFENMKPEYIDIPSTYYGDGRTKIYVRKGALRPSSL